MPATVTGRVGDEAGHIHLLDNAPAQAAVEIGPAVHARIDDGNRRGVQARQGIARPEVSDAGRLWPALIVAVLAGQSNLHVWRDRQDAGPRSEVDDLSAGQLGRSPVEAPEGLLQSFRLAWLRVGGVADRVGDPRAVGALATLHDHVEDLRRMALR